MTANRESELDRLLRELPGTVGPTSQAGVIRCNCGAAEMLAAVRSLVAVSGRLADMFAVPVAPSKDHSGSLQRVTVFALDRLGVYVQLSSPNGGDPRIARDPIKKVAPVRGRLVNTPPMWSLRRVP